MERGLKGKTVSGLALMLILVIVVVCSTFPMISRRVEADYAYTDFESGFDGWEPFTYHPVSLVQLSTVIAHSGTHSVEMYGHSYGNDTIGSGGGIRLPVTSTAGIYELTARVFVTERSQFFADSFFGFTWENGDKVGWRVFFLGASWAMVRESEGYQHKLLTYGLKHHTWHQVRVKLDVAFGTVSVWLDGSLIASQWPAFNTGEIPDYWSIDCWSNYEGTYVMHQYVDDVEVFTRMTIRILSPQNRPYTSTSVPLTFTVHGSTAWMGYSLDEQTNVTITGNTTLTDLLEGAHWVVVYANDTTGNMEASNTVHFTVDITPPTVSVLSPENTTYIAPHISLTFTVSELPSWMGYSLDEQANVTISVNTTLAVLIEGSHNIVVYANDTSGNMGASNTIFFTMGPVGVYIANAVTVFPGYRLFETTEAFPHWNLPINVTVNNEGTLPLTGSVSGYYSLDNATWLSLGPTQPISLNPSEGTVLVFYWNLRATGAGKSVYFMKFNATATCENLTSTDEFLVKIKVRILGDSDGDNDVDVGDQRKLALTMFKSSPDPLYLYYNSYPLFTDMDGDGDVDVGDSRKQQIHMFESW